MFGAAGLALPRAGGVGDQPAALMDQFELLEKIAREKQGGG